MTKNEVQVHKSEWRKKSWSIPDLLGGKHEYFLLVKQLVELVGADQVTDMDASPDLKGISAPRMWREYAPFLKGFMQQRLILWQREKGLVWPLKKR